MYQNDLKIYIYILMERGSIFYLLFLIIFVYFFYNVIVDILRFGNFDTIHIKSYLSLIILLTSIYIILGNR